MAKEDFCFTYYDGDATIDMNHMEKLCRGAYTDIMLYQLRNGRLSIDKIKIILEGDFDECWPPLRLVLSVDENGLYYIGWLDRSIKESDKAINRPVFVYFIILKNEDEEFIKIGISFKPPKRYKDYIRAGFLVTELQLKEYRNEFSALHHEMKFHGQYQKYQYIPKMKFPGCTECFSLNLISELN